MPVFVTNGDNDLLIPTPNSFELSQLIPNAHLHIYPNSGHGFLFQYAELFAKHINLCLGGEDMEEEGATRKTLMAKLS
jgi:pimeloyl-ACP methyl ester carboxylesterase